MKQAMKKYIVAMLVALSVLSLAGCGGVGGNWQDGTYTASAEGRNGDVEVTVTIAEGKMTDIVVGENSETKGVGSVAISTMPPLMLDEQTYKVDMVSGATETSKALRKAVKDCLKQAKG